MIQGDHPTRECGECVAQEGEKEQETVKESCIGVWNAKQQEKT